MRKGEGRPLAVPFVRREVGTVRDKVGGAADANDDLLECVAEVPREEGVNQGIYRRVAVAEPEQHGEHNVRGAADAEGPQQVDGEERQPTHDETAHDNCQCFGRLRLHAKPFRLQLGIRFLRQQLLRRRLGRLGRVVGTRAARYLLVALSLIKLRWFWRNMVQVDFRLSH